MMHFYLLIRGIYSIGICLKMYLLDVCNRMLSYVTQIQTKFKITTTIYFETFFLIWEASRDHKCWEPLIYSITSLNIIFSWIFLKSLTLRNTILNILIIYSLLFIKTKMKDQSNYLYRWNLKKSFNVKEMII